MPARPRRAGIFPVVAALSQLARDRPWISPGSILVKSVRILVLALASQQLLAPPPAVGQDTLAVAADQLQELPPPPSLAAVETERSRRCVPLLAELDRINTELAPLRERAQRLAVLVEMIALEDTTRAAPFNAGDPIEQAVAEWYVADQEVARQLLASGDTTLQTRRTERREAILARVREAGTAATREAEEKIAATGNLIENTATCLGVLLVRPAVVEACAGMVSALCREARGDSASGRFRLVGSAAEIWGVESLRPWSTPSRLGLSVQGSLAGASTNAAVSRGNVALVVGLEPIVRDKNAAAAEDLARLQAALDSLGLTFEHPRFMLVPGLAISLEVGQPLGGESYYFLHFGDLSNPVEDVVWSASTATGAPIAYMASVRKPALDRLAAGEPLSLTAVRFPQAGGMEGEAVYSLELPTFGQAAAVGGLIEYMSSGQMRADFAVLAPPPPAGAGAGG